MAMVVRAYKKILTGLFSLMILMSVPSVFAQTYEWSGGVDDLWGTAGNWDSSEVPDSNTEPANFAGSGSGDVDINGGSLTVQAVTVSAGTYNLMDSGSGSLTSTGALTVSGGTLTLAESLSFDASEFVLSGGTLKLEGTPVPVNGLYELYFDGTWSDTQLDPIDSGSGFLTMTPGAETTLDTALAFSGSTMNTRSGGLVGTDSIGACWHGWIRIGSPGPLTAGTISFATSSDDGSVFWVDVDQNGTFESDELIVTNKGSHGTQQRYGTASLADGLYKVAIGFYEGGGGEYMEARYAQGSTTDWASMTTVNPSDAGQDELWLVLGAGTTVDYSQVPLNATASSTLTTIGAGSAFGELTIEDGVQLTVNAEEGGDSVTFSNTVIASGSTAVTIDTSVDMYLTASNGLDGSSASVTVTKSGTGSIILGKASINLSAGSKFDVTNGSLVAVIPSALGSAALELSGGTLALSSSGGDQVYDKALTIDANSTLTAGVHGGGVTGPLTVSLGSLGNDITVSSGTLSVTATDSYTLELRGNQTGNMNIIEGSVSLAVTSTNLGTVTISGGTLTANNDLTAQSLIGAGGSFTMSGAYDLTVANNLTVGADLDFSSANLDVSNAVVTIDSGATLTDDVALTADSWDISGTVSAPGSLTATTKINIEPQRTVSYPLAGSAYLHLGDSDSANGYVALTATNSYTGRTEIERAVLQADIGVGLPSGSRIVFNQDTRDQTAILETSGTFARNIGTADGEVYWANCGGFSAKGGALTVTLEGGIELDWSSATTGFNNRDSIQFGSETADSKVELTNPIELGDVTRRIQVFDSSDSTVTSDFVRLSGNIRGTGGDNNDYFRINESWNNGSDSGLIEFTGVNSYAHRTSIDNVTFCAIQGQGLPVNSLLFISGNYDTWESIFLSSGTLNRNIGSNAGEVYWDSRGGFAARGGSLTVTLDGGATIDWSEADTGFRGQRLQLGSRYADSLVDIKNHITLDAAPRYIDVWDNNATDQDVAKLSGNIGQDVSGRQLRRGYGTGTLWLSGTNTYTGDTIIDQGVIRAVDGEGLPSGSQLYFDGDSDAYPCVFETSGTFARNIANADGNNVYWGERGGFAAYGGPLTVTLESSATLLWGDANVGFNGKKLHLGSWTANNVVTIANDVDGQNGNREMYVFGNPYSTNDYARATGVWSGFNQLRVRGDGLFVIENILRTRQDSNADWIAVNNDATLKIAEGACLISGVLSAWPSGMQEVYIQDGASLIVNGSVTSSYVEVQNNASYTKVLGGNGSIWARDRTVVGAGGVLSPGDGGVGSLSFTFYDSLRHLQMVSDSVYEWELGMTSNDTVNITGDLRLQSGWILKLMGDGVPNKNTEYTLFTYTQDFELSPLNAPSIDTSEMSSSWDTNNISIVHDALSTPKRVYITGLRSNLDDGAVFLFK